MRLLVVGKDSALRYVALRYVALGVVAAFMAACAPVIDNRGNLPSPDLLAQIRTGVQTRDDVTALLGTPSSTSAFGGESWYYISSKEERRAFLRPLELERKVVAIRFDGNGVVSEMKSFGIEDGRVIDPVNRVTPTAGTEMSVIQQLLGNIGRFSSSGKDK